MLELKAILVWQLPLLGIVRDEGEKHQQLTSTALPASLAAILTRLMRLAVGKAKPVEARIWLGSSEDIGGGFWESLPTSGAIFSTSLEL
jgi:hypothetical protein